MAWLSKLPVNSPNDSTTTKVFRLCVCVSLARYLYYLQNCGAAVWIRGECWTKEHAVKCWSVRSSKHLCRCMGVWHRQVVKPFYIVVALYLNTGDLEWSHEYEVKELIINSKRVGDGHMYIGWRGLLCSVQHNRKILNQRHKFDI